MDKARTTLEIVTNNPRVTEPFAVTHGVVFVHRSDGSQLDVLDRVEALLQEGYRLVSAPLPPNIPLMRAPYRSILIEKGARRYDVPGILAVDKARERLETQRAIDESFTPGSEEDFALIDEQLLLRALRDLSLGLALDASQPPSEDDRRLGR
ncbi:MAG: hypothetical protein GX256_05825 [Fretibacterium sp.]|nr:hypothetical protein [Fretibacterium sp.]